MSVIVAEQPSGEKQKRARREANERLALTIASLPEKVTSNLVQLFKLLSDETRLHILYYLTQRHELNVGTLCGLLKQSQPAVSHHLALLRVSGLIEMRREGKHNYYRLIPERIAVHADLISQLLAHRQRDLIGQAVSAEHSETD